MLFSKLLVFASMAFAVPLSGPGPAPEKEIEARQQGSTAVGAILNAVTSLNQTVAVDVAQITTLINEISGNATANVQIIADIRANLNDIRTAIQAATRTILSNTLGAIFGLVGATTGLTQIVVDQVTDIIQTVFSVLAQLEVGVRATQNLTPEIRTLLTNELNSLIATLAPFLTPLLVFFNAVRNLSASATVTVRGLLAAQQELGALIRRVLTSLGLGNLLALLTPPA